MSRWRLIVGLPVLFVVVLWERFIDLVFEDFWYVAFLLSWVGFDTYLVVQTF